MYSIIVCTFRCPQGTQGATCISEQPVCDIVDPCAVNSGGNCTEVERQAVCDCEYYCKLF